MKDRAVADDRHLPDLVRALNLDVDLRLACGFDLLTHFVSVDLETQHDARVGHRVVAAMAQCVEDGLARQFLGQHRGPCRRLSFVCVGSPDEPRLAAAVEEIAYGLLHVYLVRLSFVVNCVAVHFRVRDDRVVDRLVIPLVLSVRLPTTDGCYESARPASVRPRQAGSGSW